MPNESHYRRLENMHYTANCNRAYCRNLKVTIGEGQAEMVLPLTPDYYHAAGAVHGFIYFKMLDEVAFFAANSLVEDVFVLTTDFTLSLLRPVTEGEMRAVGKVVHSGKSRIIADAELYDAQGRLIARGTGSFVRGRTALDENIGYKDLEDAA